MKFLKHIKILGAGISGMSAAIILAKKGFGVDVYEKRSRVGSFFEKDIHSIRNYDNNHDVINVYRKMGINIPYVYPVYRQIRLAPSLKQIEIYSNNKPLFYNVIRGYKGKNSLDLSLFREAKKYGVKFYFNQIISEAKADIVAKGALKKKAIGYGEHYKLKSGASPLESIYVFLDNNYSPSGYSYISSFGKEFSVVSVVMENDKEIIKDGKFNIKKKFNKLKKDNKVIKNIIKNAVFQNEISGFAYYDLPENLPEDSGLLVGEAAGFLDASMGFGTHYAILSGCLAAQSIITGQDYNQLWQDCFGAELAGQYHKREKMGKLQNKDYDKIINNLIKNFGNRVASNDYVKFKKSFNAS